MWHTCTLIHTGKACILKVSKSRKTDGKRNKERESLGAFQSSIVFLVALRSCQRSSLNLALFNPMCLPLFSNHFFLIQSNNERKDKWRSCCRVVYTWKNRQPSRVKVDPNRVTRQTRIFTSVIESNVGQEEDLNLFIRGVYTCRLREGEEGGRRERGTKRKPRRGETMRREGCDQGEKKEKGEKEWNKSNPKYSKKKIIYSWSLS